VAGGSLAIERSRLGGARVRLVLPIDGEGDTGSRPAGST
jgi:hypothetical protein